MFFEELASKWRLAEISDSELFESLFSPDALDLVFNTNFAKSSGKGIDRLNGFQFSSRATVEFSVASQKCISGTYRFSPYLEVLKNKGRGKAPRLIGIPTVRDRVILSQLNHFLALIFPERVSRNVAATYVRKISEDVSVQPLESTWVCTTDIKTFYDSIQRPQLLSLIRKKIESKPALSLINHALSTPTVPKNTPRARHREFSVKEGVPQGLAISNILASIYMQPIDDAMNASDVAYYRYVDDVLMYGEQDRIKKQFEALEALLKDSGLGLHPLNSGGKSQIVELTKPFGYLGYLFEGRTITVRDSTNERFLQSIAAKFSDFTHNKTRRLEKFKYLDEKRLAQIFLMELNERITGAIKDKKRYGWIAYFNQITDLSLLHKLDHAIRSLFSRLPEFNYCAPPNLHKLSRAYWEIKFNPTGGYVRNYDKIETLAQKLEFLASRGRVAPDEALTDEQIDARFEKYI